MLSYPSCCTSTHQFFETLLCVCVHAMGLTCKDCVISFWAFSTKATAASWCRNGRCSAHADVRKGLVPAKRRFSCCLCYSVRASILRMRSLLRDVPSGFMILYQHPFYSAAFCQAGILPSLLTPPPSRSKRANQGQDPQGYATAATCVGAPAAGER